MPTYTIHCHTPLTRSFRVEQVAGLFDLPLDEIECALGALADGRAAGAGRGLDDRRDRRPFRQRQDDAGPRGVWRRALRTAALASRCRDHRLPGQTRSPIGEMTVPIKQLTRILTAVGLGSVPTWLKPYRVLSTGERFRADLARAILQRRRISRQRHGGQTKRRPADLCAPVPLCEHPPSSSSTSSPPPSTARSPKPPACPAPAALRSLLRNPKSAIRNPNSSPSPATPTSSPGSRPIGRSISASVVRRLASRSDCRAEPSPRRDLHPRLPSATAPSASPSAASRSASGPALPDITI